MKHVIAFGASNSKNSINKKFASLATKYLSDIDATIIDLNQFHLPIYSIDEELEKGIPENAIKFNALLIATDGIIISLAEHNGSYTAVFKNLFDWISRIDKSIWKQKPMLLLSTSPGGRGGASVMTTAKNSFPHLGANIIASFSLPFFNKNIEGNEIADPNLKPQFLSAIRAFEVAL